MCAAAHDARLRQPAKDGKAQRVHLEAAAARGSASAIALLDGPEFPDELGYLWGWFQELDRTRSYGMNGAEALTYPAIDAWARLTGRSPDALEVDALILLDLIARHPEAMTDA